MRLIKITARGRRRPGLALALGAALGLSATSCGGPDEDPIDDLDVPDGSGKEDSIVSPEELPGGWEYVVVGSGAGGGPLAANLARQGKRVLLLEAGDNVGGRQSYQVPALHPQATEDDAMRWDYYVKHYDDPAQAGRDSKMQYDGATQKGILYPRAGTLGGCTAHNAMITVYPHKSDWDYLARLTGDSSWGGDNMRRYFSRLERNRYLAAHDDRRGHGQSGWLQVERADPKIGLFDTKLVRMLVAGASTFGGDSGGLFGALTGGFSELLGVLNRDLNTAAPGRDSMEGLFSIPLATTGGQRNGTLEYIQSTVRGGYPLTVRTRALATRVLYATKPTADGKQKVIGVEFLDGAHLFRADPGAPKSGAGGKRRYARAAREVILAAGTFNTPQLLKLSGLGPKDELKRFGIKARVDLPGVGKNLQDRYEVGLISEAESDYSALRGCTFGAPGDPCLGEWQSRRTGVYTSNGGIVAVVKKSGAAELDPDLIIFGLPGAFKGYYKGYSKALLSDKRHFTWAILKAHTRNGAGQVTLRSADPRDTPEINFNYFTEGQDADMEAMVQGVEFVRRVVNKADDLSLFGSFTEVWPGSKVRTRADIARFVKDEAWGHHASGTVKIGTANDPLAVLDSRFRVRGTAGLRVVDASVFPKIPGFFIVVPVYMVSEKATDVILEDNK